MSQEPSGRTEASAQSQSLYRKYRPQSFAAGDLVGQDHVVRTLRNAIILGRVAHAYLFCGPRGTGKTTMARLLAKAVNCQQPDPEQRPCNACESCRAINRGSAVDIIEIDAASNRGVDDIRDLREKVKYAPTQLKVKFYIIDEAHQLTRDAFNAFLKTLEEPPAHVKFVLATTEPDKLPDTVASRCQRFDFRRIPLADAIERMRTVCRREGLDVEDEALEIVARQATGSLRDGLGLLEQLSLYCETPDGRRSITADAVRRIVGLSRNDRLIALVDALAQHDAGAGLRVIGAAAEAGEDIHQLNRQLVGYLRSLMLLSAGGEAREADDDARRQAALFSLPELAALTRAFSSIEGALNRGSYGQLPLEIALVDAIVGPAPPAPSAARSPQVSVPEPPVRSAPPRPDPIPRPRPPESTARESKEQRASTPAERPPTPPPAPERRAPAAPAGGEPVLDQLVGRWVQIRREVKAANSRIAALLSSVDPVSVRGEEVVLVSPYEFHRNKLSDDAVRRVVEDVIQRHIGGSYRITCMSPEEVRLLGPDQPVTAESAAVPSNGQYPPPEPASPEPATDADDDQRLRAAKSIFGAEEVDPPRS